MPAPQAAGLTLTSSTGHPQHGVPTETRPDTLVVLREDKVGEHLNSALGGLTPD